MILSICFAAHLLGDFILQNDKMQAKSRSSYVCTMHVAVYCMAFFLILPWPAVLAIALEHWLQDRFALHLKWMRFYHQTPPDKWPVGPFDMTKMWLLAAALEMNEPLKEEPSGT